MSLDKDTDILSNYGSVLTSNNGITNGDLFFVTDNGTNTGNILEVYVWDELNSQWNKIENKLLINNNLFDCEKDEVIFLKDGLYFPMQILDGNYFGYSYPENVGWSDIITFNPALTYKIFFDNLDTDGLGSVSTTPYISNFNSLQEICIKLNEELLNYNSSFRLLAFGSDRIFVTDLNYNVLSATSPYISNNSFSSFNIVIEDNNTNSNWILEGSNPDSVNILNQILNPFYKNKIDCCPKEEVTFNEQTDKILIKRIGDNIPSNWIGLDFDNANDFSCATSSPLGTYLHEFQGVFGQITLASPIELINQASIQNVINSQLIPALGLAINDIIYTYNSTTNIITVWYNPILDPLNIGHPNNFVIGILSASCSKPVPTIPTIVVPSNNFDKCYLTSINDLLPNDLPKPIISLATNGEPQHLVLGSPTPSFNANNIKVNISFPEGYNKFKELVSTGNVRVQLQHSDGNTYIRSRDINNVLIYKEKQRIIWRYGIHRNGTQDSGDYIFGSQCKDNGGNLYPDKDTMFYINSSIKPNQVMQFIIDPSLWYGYGSAFNCGLINTLLPMTFEDWISSVFGTLCGEGTKNAFVNKNISQKHRKYFRFLFMYKVNGKWIHGLESDVFYIELKIANTDDGLGNIQKWIIGYSSKLK